MLQTKPVHPDLFPARTYSTTEVAKFAQVTLRQLRWWDERRVVIPQHEGHKRVYQLREAIEIMVIAELRRKGFSLQKIRRVFRFLQREMGRRLENLLSHDSQYYLLTDGKSVYLEDRPERIVDLLKGAHEPMFLVCVSDQVRLRSQRCEPSALSAACRASSCRPAAAGFAEFEIQARSRQDNFTDHVREILDQV
jgi:DNA-binding transcriptional MerR regulator